MNDTATQPLAVNVASAVPGVTPTAFLAVVEYVDPDGERRFEVVESHGLTEKRRAALAEHFA